MLLCFEPLINARREIIICNYLFLGVIPLVRTQKMKFF